MFFLRGLTFAAAVIGAMATSSALAQSPWESFSTVRTNGISCCTSTIPFGAASPTDLVNLSRLVGTQGNATPIALPLGSFASSIDLQNVNARTDQALQNVNARIDQAFQSAQQLQQAVVQAQQTAQQLQQAIVQAQQTAQQLQQSVVQANRGTTAAVAMAGVSMPSAPGRTTWALNASTFQSEFGAGLSIAHRLNTNIPLAVTAAYGNGSGSAHIGRVGLMGEL